MTIRSSVEHASAQLGARAGHDAAHLNAQVGAALDGAAAPARQMLDGLARDAHNLAEPVRANLRHSAEQASDMAHDGLDALRSEGRHLLTRARHTGDFATDYIRHEPTKAVLLAVLGGALLTAAIAVFSRSQYRR